MATTDPLAFLSYVRADDEFEGGRVTALREKLEGEVHFQTGKPFSIFQDKKDISWGQQWKERLDSELFNVTFLIPIITPRYFTSTACRDEFDKFVIRERQLGQNTLILPVYYLSADEIDTAANDDADTMAVTLAQRNWADWRGLRFRELNDPIVRQSIATMASTIKANMKRLEVEISASKQKRQATVSDVIKYKPSSEIARFSPDVPEKRSFVGKKKVINQNIRSEYYAYTKEFDEIIDAKNLVDGETSANMRKEIDRIVSSIKASHHSAIAAAAYELTAAKLDRSPLLIFLVDNSGSLRGDDKIGQLAGWLQIVIETLENAKIPTEVLGFTTKAWKGGRAREKWIVDGRPAQPGRLNDLRHIIYKSAEEKSEDIRTSMGLMASGRLLKENIDGEALLWAFDRAQLRKTNRVTIIVVSDGASVDDSTLLVNPPGVLEKHLMSTINWIDQREDVDLYGVGVDHDVRRYYSKGIPHANAKDVGLEMLRAIPGWLSTPKS